ncbi:hypothetical protein N656DRAFT_772387 [Canariomyces notabilis]|uniref:Uncharacterized protein n=1 Tax=Canariomyces notabilis TaxID=2074819 RepID=A0AAN6QCK0_9PEZI|nr:hypothetical protein N656DRAFT_772387 [Canariomyces arenarius]
MSQPKEPFRQASTTISQHELNGDLGDIATDPKTSSQTHIEIGDDQGDRENSAQSTGHINSIDSGLSLASRETYTEIPQLDDDERGRGNRIESADPPEKGSKPSRQTCVEVSEVDNDLGDHEHDIEATGDSDSDNVKKSKPKDATQPTTPLLGPLPPSISHPADGEPILLGTSARLWTSLVHLLPLAMSVALVTINFKRVYWFDESWSPPKSNPRETDYITVDGIRNGLQLVAKVHELLVVASLGALTLKMFKRRLVGSRLPFGLLTGAYRVGDIPYAFSGPFWRAIGSGAWWSLGLILFVNTMIATLVGPSSAILLVPELDWYPLPGPFRNFQSPVFYDLAPNRTRPRVVHEALLEKDHDFDSCNGFKGWYAFWCPAGGYSDLWNWVQGWKSSDLGRDLLLQDPTNEVMRQLSVRTMGGMGLSGAIVTTISVPPLLSIGRLLAYIKDPRNDAGTIHDASRFRLSTSSESQIFQPLVQTYCTVYDDDDLRAGHAVINVSDTLGNLHLNCLGDSNCENMLMGDELIPVPPDIW